MLSSKYQAITDEIAQILEEKESYYGPVYEDIGIVLTTLLAKSKSINVQELLAITRIVDKLFRIANSAELDAHLDAWRDIAGYAILELSTLNKQKIAQTSNQSSTSTEQAKTADT